MELRPRPFRGPELKKGFVRISGRRWIRDPGPIYEPDHIAAMSSGEYKAALAESKAHRKIIKKSPPRPAPLDSGFYEPEILTSYRRSDDKPYPVRQPTMEPISSDQVQNQDNLQVQPSVKAEPEVTQDSFS